jgi:transposase InsO family protein
MVYEPYRRSRQPRPALDRFVRWRETAVLLGLSKEARQRLDWLIFYHTTARQNGALTCRHFGIHRNTFGKWLKLFDDANLRSLETRSRRPHRVRHRQASMTQDDRIIVLRQDHPYWGKEKLVPLYTTTYGESVTGWYVQRVIETYHLYPKRRRAKQRHPTAGYVKKRITELTTTQPHTGFLLHLDTIVLHLFGVKRYILTALDHHARLGYAWMTTSHASAAATDFLGKLRYLLDDKIENLHTDNGSEFHKHFETAATALGLGRYWSRPKTPKDNARLERFNRTLKEEFLRDGNFHPDPAVFNRKLTDWLIEYNNVRPHQALGYLTPLAFAERTMGLHTMWSSSTHA